MTNIMIQFIAHHIICHPKPPQSWAYLGCDQLNNEPRMIVDLLAFVCTAQSMPLIVQVARSARDTLWNLLEHLYHSGSLLYITTILQYRVLVGKKKRISLSALANESLPCTAFFSLLNPNSARILTIIISIYITVPLRVTSTS